MNMFSRTGRFVFAASLLMIASAFVHAAPADRAELRRTQVETIVGIAEAAVANPAFVSGERWQDFVASLDDEALLVLDDSAFRAEFNRRVRNLPFSHFRLFWRRPSASAVADAEKVDVSTPAPDVALLHVRQFEVAPEFMTEKLREVLHAGPRALIIDLRGNQGGSFPSVVALSRFLAQQPLDGGVFLTRRWFAMHGDYPNAAQRAAIPKLETMDLAAFSRQLERDGAVRLVLPGHGDPVFEGRVVLLTDAETASAAEPFVYLMQQRGVQVVGKPTAGAMLSADRIPVDETFVLFTPVADYMTPDGIRLDGRGVKPDIEVPADDALEVALDLLGEE
jgi:carboxyl-terminal processing protease